MTIESLKSTTLGLGLRRRVSTGFDCLCELLCEFQHRPVALVAAFGECFHHHALDSGRQGETGFEGAEWRRSFLHVHAQVSEVLSSGNRRLRAHCLIGMRRVMPEFYGHGILERA